MRPPRREEWRTDDKNRFYYIEHVIDPNPGVLRTAQNLLTPLQRAVAGGCNLNRDTSRAIARAFPDVREERLSVEFVSLISPHIFGSAAAGHPSRL